MTTIRLVTVIPNPAASAAIIDTVGEKLKPKYTIVNVGNSETVEGVKALLSVEPAPAILIAASTWTAEQQDEIQRIAKEVVPGIKTHAIPAGLLAEAGPEGVIKYLIEHVADVVA